MSVAHEPTSGDQFAIDLDTGALKSRALLGSVLTAGAQAIKIALQLGSTLILARLLFPADFGLIAMVYPVIGFIELSGNLGFGHAIVQRKELRDSDVSAIFWLNLAIMTGLAVVGIVVSPVAAWIYGESRVTFLMMAVSLTLPLGALGSIHGALLSRLMRFGINTRNDVVVSVVGVFATVTCAYFGFSYWSLVMGQLAATVVSVCLAWVSMPWRPSRPSFSSGVGEFVKFGANLTGANLASFLSMTGDNIIIGVMNGKVALGIYDRSYKLVVQPLSQLLAPVGSVALPLLSRLQSDPDEYRHVYLRIVRIMMLVNLPIMLICITNAREIVAILLGPNWKGAAVTFAWISVGGLLSGFNSSLSWLFISQNKTDVMRRYMTASAVINLASFAIGAFWGVEGVAACAAVGFVLIAVPLTSYGATKTGPVSLKDVALCMVPFSMIGFIAFLSIETLNKFNGGDDFLQLIFSISACAIVFLAGCLIFPSLRDVLRFGWSRLSLFWHSRQAPVA